MTVAELWSRGQRGWPRAFPVVQLPNPPLLLALAGWVLAGAASGDAHQLGRAIVKVALAVWAWEEVTRGVNWLRRLVGLVALVWVVAGLAGEL